MIEFNSFGKTEKSYSVDWSQVGTPDLISALFDKSFNWIDPVNNFQTLDEQRSQMLSERPDLDIKTRLDGYELETEKLLAIQQNSSKGFTVIDINPALLNPTDYALSIPYEFLFDGTGFMPDVSGSITKNFRTVSLDIAGTFLKVEYLQENNSYANLPLNPANAGYTPSTQIKYADAIKSGTEGDLSTFQTNYTFDNFARNKTFVSFGGDTSKPQMVTQGGDSFKTYFNSIAIHLNIGAPKIRLTIGFNSEKLDGPSDAPINARLAVTGGARFLNNIDTTLSPFCLTAADMLAPTVDKRGVIPLLSFIAGAVTSYTFRNFITNKTQIGVFLSDPPITSPTLQQSLGYSVLWIQSIDLDLSTFTQVAYGRMSFELYYEDSVTGATKRIYETVMSFDFTTGGRKVSKTISFSEPLRVVIPSGQTIKLIIGALNNEGSNQFLFLGYSITGYSLGELIKVSLSGSPTSWTICTSKTVTDSTFLSDYNRVTAL